MFSAQEVGYFNIQTMIIEDMSASFSGDQEPSMTQATSCHFFVMAWPSYESVL